VSLLRCPVRFLTFRCPATCFKSRASIRLPFLAGLGRMTVTGQPWGPVPRHGVIVGVHIISPMSIIEVLTPFWRGQLLKLYFE
jgi:hypothetical protein